MAFDCTTHAPCALVYQSELDFVSRCILDRKHIETGGELFGFWTATGIPVVLFAIGPGPKANHQATFFNQDIDYLVRVGRRLIRQFGLQHIGEWHSHHQLGLAQPSVHDAHTMSSCIANRHLGRFVMGLGNCDESCSTFNAFEFVEGHGTDFHALPWDIKPGTSPFRAAIENDRELMGLLVAPRTPAARQGAMLFAEETWQE